MKQNNTEYINECKSCGYITDEHRCKYCKTSQYLVKKRKEIINESNENNGIF